MNISKVEAYLRENEYGNPLTDETVKTIHKRILTKDSEVGKLILRLMTKSEEGAFKWVEKMI